MKVGVSLLRVLLGLLSVRVLVVHKIAIELTRSLDLRCSGGLSVCIWKCYVPS